MSPNRIRPAIFPSAGPQSVRDATRLIEPPAVPFPWDLPPENSIWIWQPGSIAAPAPATITQILSYQVPDGFVFYLKARMNVFTQGSGGAQNWVPGSGDVTWTTDVNTAVGVTSSGQPIQGLQAELFGVGSFDHGPVPVHGRLAFQPNDIIRVKVTTTANIQQGAPNYFNSAIEGWLVPIDSLGSRR